MSKAPPGIPPGHPPGKTPENAADALASLVARYGTAPDEFFVTARVFKVAVATNVPPVYVDDIPMGDLAQAYTWLAERQGAGVFRIQPLLPNGAHYAQGTVDLHIGIDRRPGRTTLAAAAPAAAAAAPAAVAQSPVTEALSLVQAVMQFTKTMLPTAATAPASNPVDIIGVLKAGMELGQGAKIKKSSAVAMVEALKENSDIVLPIVTTVAGLGQGALEFLRDVLAEAKADKQKALEAAQQPQPSAPAPSAPPETSTEGTHPIVDAQTEAPPAAGSSVEDAA